ncbi:MAG: hypothetical protein RLZZ628_3144 [Bacteroidota bacterium]|jgi:integrase
MDKKNIAPKIFNANGDLTKRWYVEFYKEGVRHRSYGEINRCKSVEARMQAAKELLASCGRDNLKAVIWEQHETQSIGLRKKTIQTNASKLNTFLAWAQENGISDLKQVDEKVANRFFKELARQKKHTTTLNAYKQVLNALFSKLNVFAFEPLKRHPKNATPAKAFQEQDVERLQTVIMEKDPQLWFFIRFVHNCLIRPNSELRLLKVGDIDLQNALICIKATISKNKKHQYVIIPDDFLPDLLFLKQYSPDFYLFSKEGTPGLKPVGYNYFYNHHVKFLKELGFGERYELYSWKHTGAVNMVKKGVPMKQIQLQGRWHSLDQLDEYLRSMGIQDMPHLKRFPSL